ncbi:hypothetical protein BDV98DRAFT_577347 [Pterulicium gracile]|uniref:Uncharacterized protein n=1 Tax=Pterulicium gracile TaxID=1884261 RepID=A0A5C3Q3M1_9AGAR|nr:hypothetical protein BDV98DRAFT_577347 [Pterula gracilis]
MNNTSSVLERLRGRVKLCADRGLIFLDGEERRDYGGREGVISEPQAGHDSEAVALRERRQCRGGICLRLVF